SKVHTFQTILLDKWLAVDSFACSAEQSVGDSTTCWRQRWLSQSCWINSIVYKMDIYFRDFFHADEAIAVEVFLFGLSVFESELTKESMTKSIGNSSAHLVQSSR